MADTGAAVQLSRPKSTGMCWVLLPGVSTELGALCRAVSLLCGRAPSDEKPQDARTYPQSQSFAFSISVCWAVCNLTIKRCDPHWTGVLMAPHPLQQQIHRQENKKGLREQKNPVVFSQETPAASRNPVIWKAFWARCVLRVIPLEVFSNFYLFFSQLHPLSCPSGTPHNMILYFCGEKSPLALRWFCCSAVL